jgi:MFS family permease
MTTGPQRALPAVGSSYSLANGGRVFRHRNYRLFFLGQTVSIAGTWMQQVAQAWLVLELTNDPFMLGLVTAAAFLPVLVLGLFGGLVADALPKRQTLIATQVVQMLLAFALGILAATGRVEVWQILLLATLLGITNAVDMPTRQAFAIEMVGREDIANAVAINSAMFNGARIVGPAIAGLAIGAFGVATAFMLNGLSFLAVIGAYAMMRDTELFARPPLVRPESLRAVGSTLAEGLRYVRRTDLVLLATVTVGLASTFGMNFGVMIPALARDVLHTDATGYGFLMAATGIGALAAALLIAFSGRSRPVLIGSGAVLLGVGLVIAATLQSFGPALGAVVVMGFGAIAMAATANTTIQLNVPDALRGRVISVYTTVFVGSTPLGGLISGWLASRFGVDVALAIGGAASMAVGLVALAWLRRIRSSAARRSALNSRHEGAGIPASARPR